MRLGLGGAALLIPVAFAGCLRPEAPDPRDEALSVLVPRGTLGDLSQSLLLTGELEAAAAENLVVPRVPQWNIALRWLASDGTLVEKGEIVAELDNSNFATDLADKKLAAARSARDLAHQVSQDAILEADKTFALDTAKIALDKARLSAAIEKDALPLRDYQERQVELERAGVAFERAQDDLAAHRKSAALEAQIRGITLEKSQREIQAAEQAIRELVLRAPSDGLVVVSPHPWFGRKVQGGDNVWVGLSLVRLPELSTMQVNARLSDVDDGRIKVGMPAVSYLDAYPEIEFPGVISEVSPVAREPSRDSWRRSFHVTIALDHVDLERMRPGMSVRVEVESQRAQASLLAPRASFQRNAVPARLQLEQGSVEVDPAADWLKIGRGDLALGVEVSGELEAVDSDSLGPPLVSGIGEFKIARMAPEGQPIEKGQPALGFDTSELTRKLEEKQNERASVAAEIGRKHAAAALARKDEELRIAETTGKLRKAELKAQRSEELTSSLELQLARLDFALAKKELAYQEAKAKATRQQDKGDLAALEFREQEAERRVSEIQAALPQLTVAAPRSGTVIYISNRNSQKKKVGDAIWRGERVLETAALDRMRGRGQIDEADVSKITLGQHVTLRLEAYPDLEYTGTLKDIARLVERQSPDNPRRIVRTLVELDHTEVARMRPGMRFRGRAETERISGAVLVPLSAVFLTGQGPVAYRRTRLGAEPVKLTLGKSNAEYAEVVAGLVEGDEVTRSHPEQEGSRDP